MTAAKKLQHAGSEFVTPSACAVVIPCYNEAKSIAPLILSIRRFMPHIIVVDDGSTDGTGMHAVSSDATVITHAKNRGKGAALRTGLEHARQSGFAWALTMDGDGQHAPEDIATFLERAGSNCAELVVGNRFHAAHRIPFLRRCINRIMSSRISKLSGVTLPDSQCGFRLLNLDAWARLPLTMDRFETESELLLEFIRAGRVVEFIPVQVIYHSNGSKINPLLDTIRWLRWWLAQPRHKLEDKQQPEKLPC
jgi:glycosyltransferase involved in cell wall biosynthesis